MYDTYIYILLGIFISLILLRVPIGVALGISAVYVIYKTNLGLSILSYNFYAGIAKFPLIAIPFFILAGNIMEKTCIAEKIVVFIEKLVGSLTGGLAIATVIIALFWGAVSGSGPATVAALGLILIPSMVKQGYDKTFATSVVSVSSGLAIIIPPSIAFIVYGVITNVSIGALFAAGVIPGMIVALFLIVCVYLISKKRGYKSVKIEDISIIDAFKGAFWGLLAPFVILGGIYGGIFTPTEAATVAVFYGIFIGFFIYKTLTFKKLYEALKDTVISTSVIMIVVTFAGIFSWTGTSIGLVDKATQILFKIKNPYLILLLVNIILLFSGMILDAISIFYVFLPLFMPIMEKYKFDPLWFGVLMTVNLAIGQITPPVAVNLYVGSNISGIPLEKLSKEVIPFVIASIIALLIITYLPELSLYLPEKMGIYSR